MKKENTQEKAVICQNCKWHVNKPSRCVHREIGGVFVGRKTSAEKCPMFAGKN